MPRFLDAIRPAVRAVIYRQGKLLVQVKRKPGTGVWLTLPGGKQEPGETLQDAVARECLEEVGAAVAVGRLLHVAEIFKPKQEGLSHRVEMLFACEVAPDYVACMGPQPDPSQIDVTWASPLEEAARFRPAFAPHLADPDAPLYLGVFDG